MLCKIVNIGFKCQKHLAILDVKMNKCMSKAKQLKKMSGHEMDSFIQPLPNK